MRASLSVALDPSHTRRRSVGFRKARQRRYKILLLRPPCGVCLVRQLVPSVIASRQKNATRGIELILFFWRLTPGIDQSLQKQVQATPASDRSITNGWSPQGWYFKANSTPNRSSPSFVGLFFALQRCNTSFPVTSSPRAYLHVVGMLMFMSVT